MPETRPTSVRKGVRIPMRDGAHLAADLYFPADQGEPRPVVIEYQPYRKDEVDENKRFYSYLPEHGYIVARLEVRGTGASEGRSTDEYLPQEQEDGYDAIEWLATQPFCDGNVNMMGISYGGFTALQVATLQPPHLRSVIPIHFTDDRYTDDCHYVGGQPRLYYDVGFYGTFMVAYNALPPDPEWADDWAELWKSHVEHNEPYLLEWLRHQTDGAYWRHGSVGDIAERITCPVFMIGGWVDGYRNVPLRLFAKLQVPKRAIVGPWNHAMPDAATPGPRIDHLHEVKRWLDRWCGGEEGADAGEAAPIAIYEQRHDPPVDAGRVHQPGRWRGETSWPPESAGSDVWFLGDERSLTRASGGDADDRLEYDATVGTTAGLWSAGVPFGLAGDQRLDEALSLTYTSPALDADLHVLGRPVAELHVTPSAAVIAYAVSLSDVAPDGSSQLVTKGFLNATRRASRTDPEPLVPGQHCTLAVELDCTSWRFQPGHRIRVAIANADWPNVWPTPEPATSEIHRGGRRPSRLSLPTVAASGAGPVPEFRPAPEEPQRLADEPHPPVWRIERDGLTREARVRYAFEYSARVNARTVVDRSYEFTAHVDPEAPAHASARGRHVTTIRRPSGTIRGTSSVSVRGTPTRLHVTIGVEVDVDGATHHRRSWTESVPRRLV